MIRVGLFGTTSDSTWREELISKLDINNISYFNPVVDNWNEECIDIENEEKKKDDILLFVITPELQGFYSIAEATHASNVMKQKCIFCPIKKYGEKEFNLSQWKSIQAICKLLLENNTRIFYSLDDTADYLNRIAKSSKVLF